MKVLWITNIELPEIAAKFGRKYVVCGWLTNPANRIKEDPELELYAACPSDDKFFCENINHVTYYSLGNEEKLFARNIYNIMIDCRPDVIHIWGTEYKHTWHAVKCANELGIIKKVVISIQGLVSVYQLHYLENVPFYVIHSHTLKEFVRPNLLKAQKNMKKRGQYEIKALENVHFCIGRTDWDYACVKQINPQIIYNHCNETLRDEFYNKEWSYEKCQPHSIFFSQAFYPIKGFHIMLEAAKIVKKFYSDMQIRVVGEDKCKLKGIGRLRVGSFDKYLHHLIGKYDLENNISWLGDLDAADMVGEYLRANVFVCSSLIENSSNSVGEAMLLGMPVVASDVGGIKSLMTHNIEGLIYQTSSPYMLADCIMRIFADSNLASQLGYNAHNRAIKTHNSEKNYRDLKSIYRKVMSENETRK